MAARDKLGFEAELARLVGTATPESWQVVADGWGELGAAHREAYARLRLAEAHLDHRQQAAAGQQLSAADRLAAGHVPLRAEVAALARRAGLRLEAAEEDPAPAPAPVADRFHLTDREQAVLELLVEGLTNAQIARRLTIIADRPRTVIGSATRDATWSSASPINR